MLPRQAAALVLGDVGPLRDAQQRIVRLVIVGGGEIDLVGGDDRQGAGISDVEQGGLGLDLVLEAVPLDLDVEPVAEDLLQNLQAFEGDLFLALAQSLVDRPIRSPRQRDQAAAMGFQPLDLDVRCLVLGGVEEGLGGEFHEVLPAPLIARQQSECAGGLRAGLIGAVALQPIGLGAVAEIDLQRAAHDRLDACFGELVGEFQRAEEVAGIRETHRGKALRHRQLGELLVGDGAFQQRIGRVHLEVHELRRWRGSSGAGANRFGHGEL